MQTNDAASIRLGQRLPVAVTHVTDKYTKEIGESMIKQVNAEIEKARVAQK